VIVQMVRGEVSRVDGALQPSSPGKDGAQPASPGRTVKLRARELIAREHCEVCINPSCGLPTRMRRLGELGALPLQPIVIPRGEFWRRLAGVCRNRWAAGGGIERWTACCDRWWRIVALGAAE
jgi:hypothetical protein